MLKDIGACVRRELVKLLAETGQGDERVVSSP